MTACSVVLFSGLRRLVCDRAFVFPWILVATKLKSNRSGTRPEAFPAIQGRWSDGRCYEEVDSACSCHTFDMCTVSCLWYVSQNCRLYEGTVCSDSESMDNNSSSERGVEWRSLTVRWDLRLSNVVCDGFRKFSRYSSQIWQAYQLRSVVNIDRSISQIAIHQM